MLDTSSSQTEHAIISVLGGDRPGIVAAVSTVLAEHKVNILDISQTILQGTFTMTMLVDLESADSDFACIQDALTKLESSLGVQISMQREDVFKFMYRL
ncbi:ACT domain-containing protein [Atopobium fossor]|uniref:ACT domain-containing protein n=1 Tax=Atopobium fossor TaxID=39487 RepID=UPI0004288304|nr:ACT domain-containing protein [Atopobium fossor]